MKAKKLVNAVSYHQAEAEAGRLKDDTQGDVEAEPLVSNLLEAPPYTRRNPRHSLTNDTIWRLEQ